MLTSHSPFPTWHFDTNNWILSREMGNKKQMRILVTEVSPSELWNRLFRLSDAGDRNIMFQSGELKEYWASASPNHLQYVQGQDEHILWSNI